MDFKRLRTLCNLSQKKMASLMGVPVRTYEDWERGIATPPVYVQKRLEEFITNYLRREELNNMETQFTDTEKAYIGYNFKLLDAFRDGKLDTKEHRSNMTGFYVMEAEIMNGFDCYDDALKHIKKLRQYAVDRWIDDQDNGGNE